MQNHKAILKRKLQDLFPDEVCRRKAADILERYGPGPYDKEPDRVRLAILKLSGSDLEKLQRNTNRARQDYRDVLAWAEYPRQSRHWSVPAGDEKSRMVKADRQEYEDWLKS